MARSRRTRKGGKRNRKMKGGQSLPMYIPTAQERAAREQKIQASAAMMGLSERQKAEAKTTPRSVSTGRGVGMAAQAAPAPTGEIESLMQFVNLLEQLSPGKIMPLIQTMQNTNNRIISQALMFAQMKRPFDEKQMAISSLLSEVLRLYKIAWMSAKDKMKFNKYTISILPILMPIVKDQMTKEIGTYI